MLLGRLLLHGLAPRPLLFSKESEFVTGLYGGLVAANLLQLPIGILFLAPCVWLVNRPSHWQVACIFALILSGVYSINGSMFEVGLVLGLSVFGFFLRICDVPVLPLVLGLVLGYMIESNLRRSLTISDGDATIFLRDPLSAGFLACAGLIVATAIWRKSRQAGSSP